MNQFKPALILGALIGLGKLVMVYFNYQSL